MEVKLRKFKKKLKRVLFDLLSFFGVIRKSPFVKRKLQLSDFFSIYSGYKILYGPFKGFQFTRQSSWSSGDRASMIFGLYELDILRELSDVPKNYRYLINLGAADGYYSIGALSVGLFDRSYSFEISTVGQKIIKQVSELNLVANKSVCFGAADRNFYSLIPSEHLDLSVVLVDIEGGEFDIFYAETFLSMRNSIFIIELHEFYSNSREKTEDLILKASQTHEFRFIYPSAKNPSQFPELASIPDDDRWIICSEGRPEVMRWLRFDPIKGRSGSKL